VMFFAWFCNMAMHIGLADLSLLRYAKKWTYGFASAAGMFLGHFIAWIASGILCAAAVGEVAPGPIAYLGAGVAGIVCVVIAGWTTANPTLYRAGLALQVVTPNWKRWKMTLVAGAITTLAALFPALVMKLLEFVSIYGLVLMPMGVVIFIDLMILPKLGLKSNYAETFNKPFNIAAGVAWLITLSVCLFLNLKLNVQVFFLGAFGIMLTFVLYLLGSLLTQKR